MKRILIALVISLTLVFPAFAQDATVEVPTPTVEETVVSTAEPTAEPTPAPESNVDVPSLLSSVFGIVALAVAVFGVGGFSLVALMVFLNRKDVQDQLERAYESLSPEGQRQLRDAYEQVNAAQKEINRVATELLAVFDKITDKLPNA